MGQTRAYQVLVSLSILAIGLSLQSCPAVTNALLNLRRMEFRLGSVTNVRLSGIDLASKRQVSDFSMSEGVRLAADFAARRMPVDMTLNVEARNPNSGQSTTRNSTLTLSRMDFRLLIDDTPTINGDISSPVDVPSSGGAVTIPVTVGLDMYQFFGSNGYDRLLNLALALAGSSGASSRVSLDARPTVASAFGPITYPGRITIVSKEFRGQ